MKDEWMERQAEQEDRDNEIGRGERKRRKKKDVIKKK